MRRAVLLYALFVALKLTDPVSAKGDSQPRDPDYPLLGETLGLWVLERGLGRGGMGEVYEARYDFLHLLTLRYEDSEKLTVRAELEQLPDHEQARLASDMLGTELLPSARFAIKVCSARNGTAGHRRFLQEAELAKRLGEHPNIVTVHAINRGVDSEVDDSALEQGKFRDVGFMVMDLAKRDYDHRILTIPQSVHVVRSIALALDYAHQQRVVHRDLKPENILGSVEYPLLTDFGIAKEIDQSLGLTRTGQIIGTLDYMSPEQATDAKNVSEFTDIYSLGVVLYEMATGGHLPYIHLAEREACLAAIRSERQEPRWPRFHRPDFPVGLERIILRAMSHRPQHRYSGMASFIRDLDRFSRGEWISPVGRISPRRWARYQLQCHPHLSWGLPLGLFVICALWVAVNVPVWFDEERKEVNRQLANFNQQVEDIKREMNAQGLTQQLDSEQRQRWLVDLPRKLDAKPDHYSEQRQQFIDLRNRLYASRYLNVVLNGMSNQRPDFAEAQLRIAANIRDPNWVGTSEGLQMLETTHLTFGPYGDPFTPQANHGVWVHVDVDLKATKPEDFMLLVREYSHTTHWTKVHIGPERQGRRSLFLSQVHGEAPDMFIKEKFEQPQLRFWIWVGVNQVSLWSQSRHPSIPRPGLDMDRYAAIELQLPERAILRRLEIFPTPPAGLDNEE